MCCLPIKIHSIGCMVHDDADWHFRHFRHLFTFNQKYCQNNIFPLMCNLIQIEKDIFCFDQIQNFLFMRYRVKQRGAFSVIGPSTWNELPLTQRLLPRNNVSSFCKLLN